MAPYRNITILLFSLIMLCLAVMAFTGSFWLIVILAGLVPVLVVIQVLAVLRGNEEQPLGGDERWYENR